ncbi:MAG: polymorphic toxin-type HINT domain-containing protein [Gemmatimonadota bacterium]|nr:polymorphic toxin-type HINT domain-containing protein [Gemmatimonadota bacterium]
MFSRNLLRAGAVSCALLASTCLTPAQALAQTAPPPRFQKIDANGVDLVSGRFVFEMVEGSIGSGDGAVTLTRSERSDYGQRDDWSGSLTQLTSGGVTTMQVTFRNHTETFTLSGSTWVPNNANGSALTGDTYTAADGTRVGFGLAGEYSYGPCVSGPPECLVVLSVTKPNGTIFTYDWTLGEQCQAWDEEFNCTSPIVKIRKNRLSSSTGYSYTFNYPSVPLSNSSWTKATGATFTNSVNAPPSNPAVTYTTVSSTVTDITDTNGRTWRITKDSSGRITGIRQPGSTSNDITVSYDTAGRVSSVTKDGVATTYSYSVSGTTATETITDAQSQVTTIVSDLNLQRVTSVTNPLSRTTSFQYDASARPTRVTQPEGNYAAYTYDSRGNVTEERHVAKTGSGLADIVSTASYSSTCSNVFTCNQPTNVTDARGNVTDYTYDTTHGGPLTVTQPAPTSGGTRPQTRYSYALTNGEYRLTGISACSAGTSPGCVGTSDEARTVVAYDANANVSSLEQRNGSGTISATTAATYDPLGNLLTVDGPLSGTADTTRYRYNAANEVVGVVGADPDGAGSLKHRGVRTTRDGGGRVTKVERGTVNSQSDADWTTFSSLEEVQTGYDSNHRPLTQKLVAGGTTYALTQTSYDSAGRVDCVAQRMNPAVYGSLPASACTLGTPGSFGPDRISQTVYDAAGHATQLKVALGTTDAATERTLTYTNNGKLASLLDAESNLTTYEYEGHDRLLKKRFPVATKGANSSSTTDFEQLGYDAGSNVTSRRLRDGQSIAFTFDALNRVTSKDLPGTEPDVSYGYDNLGRLTSANQTGNNLSFTYDALSRNLTQAGPQGTVTAEWDLAGRRTKLTYPGSGLFVNYDYLVTDDVTKIRENGATSGIGVLATFGYDDLGRRTSLTFGNGASQSYTFDAVSRLASLTANLSGTTNDLTIGSMSYSPASQVVSQNRSNDAYAWTGHGSGSTASVANGLNQVTSIGGGATAHDARGNLATDPTTGKTYGYSSENLLTSASGGMTLAYDPQMRLYQVAGASTTRFAYDGLDIIAEYDGSNALQRRFVHGPRADEPLVQYEGSGTGDRRFLHTDERRSIVAVSDGNGAMLAINKYDEFGKPQSTNTGRFQYTGQLWLPEFGLYHYKARANAPHLGRFLQTDPIGYWDSPNLYAHVLNDPVNLSDPMGLQAEPDPSDDVNGDGVVDQNDEIIVTGRRPKPRTFCDENPWFCPSSSPTFDIALIPGGGSFGGGGAGGSWGEQDCGCFEAATLVATPDGLVRIEEIVVGDLVLAINESTGEIAPKPVIQLVRPQPKPLYRLEVRDADGEVESFYATDDHPWKIDGGAWAETHELEMGNRISTSSGGAMTVTGVNLTNRVERTYNLTVADWHTFLVGEDGAIVHNVDCGKKKRRVPGKTGKEASKDIPSWARGEAPDVRESGKEFAERLMNARYGSGNYPKGPGSQFSKIQKYGDRAFK